MSESNLISNYTYLELAVYLDYAQWKSTMYRTINYLTMTAPQHSYSRYIGELERWDITTLYIVLQEVSYPHNPQRALYTAWSRWTSLQEVRAGIQSGGLATDGVYISTGCRNSREACHQVIKNGTKTEKPHNEAQSKTTEKECLKDTE